MYHCDIGGDAGPADDDAGQIQANVDEAATSTATDGADDDAALRLYNGPADTQLHWIPFDNNLPLTRSNFRLDQGQA